MRGAGLADKAFHADLCPVGFARGAALSWRPRPNPAVRYVRAIRPRGTTVRTPLLLPSREREAAMEEATAQSAATLALEKEAAALRAELAAIGETEVLASEEPARPSLTPVLDAVIGPLSGPTEEVQEPHGASASGGQVSSFAPPPPAQEPGATVGSAQDVYRRQMGIE